MVEQDDYVARPTLGANRKVPQVRGWNPLEHQAKGTLIVPENFKINRVELPDDEVDAEVLLRRIAERQKIASKKGKRGRAKIQDYWVTVEVFYRAGKVVEAQVSNLPYSKSHTIKPDDGEKNSACLKRCRAYVDQFLWAEDATLGWQIPYKVSLVSASGINESKTRSELLAETEIKPPMVVNPCPDHKHDVNIPCDRCRSYVDTTNRFIRREYLSVVKPKGPVMARSGSNYVTQKAGDTRKGQWRAHQIASAKR